MEKRVSWKMYILLFVVFILTACGKKNEINQSPSLTMDVIPIVSTNSVSVDVMSGNEIVSENSDIEATASENMLDRSVVSVGNNYRFLKAVEKARDGEPVTIVWLGGSITQGYSATPREACCFARRATNLFEEKFARYPGQVKYINAGISGTPSTLGLLRCQRDVLDYQPDIVFVEFAVNDLPDSISQNIYESLIRTLLESDNGPAVILLFTVGENGYSAQDNMQDVGQYYDLGMISVKDSIFPEIEKGTMTFNGDYGYDQLHPNNAGHTLITEMIGTYFDRIIEEEPDDTYIYPEKEYTECGFTGVRNVAPYDSFITSTGAFSYQEFPCYSYKNAWCKPCKSKNSAFTFTKKFQKLIIAYEQFNDTSYGQAEVYVDGVCVATLNGYEAWGYENIGVIVVYNQEVSADHDVVIKMAQKDRKKAFALISVGYIP